MPRMDDLNKEVRKLKQDIVFLKNEKKQMTKDIAQHLEDFHEHYQSEGRAIVAIFHETLAVERELNFDSNEMFFATENWKKDNDFEVVTDE